MVFEIHNRHFNLEDELKEKLEKRLAKLERFSPRAPLAVRLTITQEGGSFSADLAYYLKNSDFFAKGQGPEPDLAAEGAIESMERQLRRYKEKLTDRGRDEEGGLGVAMSTVGAVGTEGAVREESGFQLKDLTVEGAVEAFQRSLQPFLVFREHGGAGVAVIYKREDGEYGLVRQLKD